MNLCVDSKSISYNYSLNSLENLVDRLERAGYEPLVRKALETLCSSLGGSADDIFSLLAKDVRMKGSREVEHEASLRRLVDLERLGYSWQADGSKGIGPIHKVAGELFFTEDHAGILFLTVVEYAGKGADSKTPGTCKVRVGYLGDPEEKSHFNRFAEEVARAYEDIGVDLKGSFVRDEFQSHQFQRLAATDSDANYHFAPAISDKDSKAAKVLESKEVREIGTLVRNAGVILAKELLKQSTENPAGLIKFVDSLLQSDLLRQEYVVICSKTGGHVLRVENRDALERMSHLGVLCSCGQPISSEPMEGLLAADPMLHRMLDGNYWLVATVIRQLHALGVPSERIMIHSSDDGQDVEFIVDLDGTLVMFEFTDGEFGINQALIISPRIGIYQPKILFVAATAGISADVKEHFARTRPDTEVVYVPDVEQLESSVRETVDGIRMGRALAWIASFQSLLTFPLAPVLLSNLRGSAKSQSLQMMSSLQIHATAEPAKAASIPANIQSNNQANTPANNIDLETAQIQAEFERVQRQAELELEQSDMRSALSRPIVSEPQPEPVAPPQPQLQPEIRASVAPASDLIETPAMPIPAAPALKREAPAQPPAPWENLESLSALSAIDSLSDLDDDIEINLQPAISSLQPAPAVAPEAEAPAPVQAAAPTLAPTAPAALTPLAETTAPATTAEAAPATAPSTVPAAAPAAEPAPGTKAASLGLSIAKLSFDDDTDLDDELDLPWGDLEPKVEPSAAAQLIQQLELPSEATPAVSPSSALADLGANLARSISEESEIPSASAATTAAAPPVTPPAAETAAPEAPKSNWQSDSLTAVAAEAKSDFQILDSAPAESTTAGSGWASDSLTQKSNEEEIAPPAAAR